MKLTTKGRYAVTAILDMVVYGGNLPVNLADIAQRESLSVSYLEQLFARLRRAGVVESVRGPGGGYCLAIPADQLTVIRVLEAAGEEVGASRCQGEANCCGDRSCLTHALWQALDHVLHEFLDGMNFARLASRVCRSGSDTTDKAKATVAATNYDHHPATAGNIINEGDAGDTD